MSTRLDHREGLKDLARQYPLAVMRLLLEHINVLRTKAGLAALTEAEVLTRLRALVRNP